MKYMDEAISELDNMDSLVSSYKIHLNVRTCGHFLSLSFDEVICRLSATTYPISNHRIEVYKYKHRTSEHF